MAQPLTAQKRRQRILLGAFVALLVISAGVLWFGFLRPEPVSIAPALPPSFREIQIDFELLDNSPAFQSLPEPPEPLPAPERVGRENPFVPF